MTPKIKLRIEQIQNGSVPDGYKKLNVSDYISIGNVVLGITGDGTVDIKSMSVEERMAYMDKLIAGYKKMVPALKEYLKEIEMQQYETGRKI